MMSAVYETNKKILHTFFWEGNGLKTNPPRKKTNVKTTTATTDNVECIKHLKW